MKRSATWLLDIGSIYIVFVSMSVAAAYVLIADVLHYFNLHMPIWIFHTFEYIMFGVMLFCVLGIISIVLTGIAYAIIFGYKRLKWW